MRINACLWGGAYNPIIPVFKTTPKAWKTIYSSRTKGVEVAQGYIRFFEPDVFVEAEAGLLEEIGLGALRKNHGMHPQVGLLADLLKPRDGREWAELGFGLSMHDVFSYLYEKEERFEARQPVTHLLIKPEKSNAMVEAMFGAYPAQKDADYFPKNYKNIFEPKEMKATPSAWREAFKKVTKTPISLTTHGLEKKRFWHHDLTIFVFDSSKPTDLIDLWNMRLEPRPVLPVPIAWFSELLEEIKGVIKKEFRPVRGNPNGVMHNATIEMARSIDKNKAEELRGLLGTDFPAGALSLKLWRTPVWEEHVDDFVYRDRRLEVTAAETRVRLDIKEDGKSNTLSFEALSPEFADTYGAHDYRWINAVRLSLYGAKDKLATTLPFNTFDRKWPPLAMLGGDEVAVGTEGWIYSQRFKNSTETINLLTNENAISGALRRLGVEAKLSEPGRIAKQMLDHLGGLWSVNVLADLETIQLLNKMAGGLRRRVVSTGVIEETFERRTARVKDWTDLISRRKAKKTLPRVELEGFTRRNLIVLGLETECPKCQALNWHSLSNVDYQISCERCLNSYDFPQANLRQGNENWHYRVTGPFSVPDYGRGSYSALLTLRALTCLGGLDNEFTYSPAMELKFDGIDAEADFIALRSKGTFDHETPPDLLIGEAKSLGQGDLIKPKDLKKLKAIAKKLPGAFVVVSVMRDHFTKGEKKILTSFVNWGRRKDKHGRATNPVILMTSHELFVDHLISPTWKELGPPYANFADYNHTRDLHSFADSTQQIYLGLQPLFYVRSEARKKRLAKRAKATPKA
ncbi:MAG TPA: hypothetical protein VHP58_00980 [Alphaproteobacteria bacterium]|nr:hypothetical protein [Alphaproteobacteria bacterium]